MLTLHQQNIQALQKRQFDIKQDHLVKAINYFAIAIYHGNIGLKSFKFNIEVPDIQKVHVKSGTAYYVKYRETEG